MKPFPSRRGKGLLTCTDVLVGDTGIEPVTPTVSTKINTCSDLLKRDSGTSGRSIGSRWMRFSAVERIQRLPMCSHALLPPGSIGGRSSIDIATAPRYADTTVSGVVHEYRHAA